MSETESPINPTETDARGATIAGIIEKQKKPLPSYQRAEGPSHRATVWNASPPGVEIHSREWGGPRFDLLKPINNMVTTYDEGRKDDGLLAFAKEQGIHARSYLTAKPETVPYSAIEEDSSIPESFKQATWHDKNIVNNDAAATHYLIDDKGNTIKIEERSLDHHTDPNVVKKANKVTFPDPNSPDSGDLEYTLYKDKYFRILGPMTDNDLKFYDKALDEFRDVTKPRSGLARKANQWLRHLTKRGK